MKKLVLSVLVFNLLFLIVGCKGNQTGDNLTVKNGTEVAKILLANQRLDGKVFQESGTLFTDGKKALNNIVKETKKYLSSTKGRPGETYTEVEGDTIRWYNDVDYANFMSYFESYAVNIEASAESGSNLIDYTKKYIRVVNKWVKSEETEYYLMVEKDSETIVSRHMGRVEICRRYLDENGYNTYEILMIDDNHTSKMKYIPGLVYEFVSGLDKDNYHYLIADKSKGYWNILSSNGISSYEDTHLGVTVESFTPSLVTLKDDANYEMFYHIDSTGYEYLSDIEMISADGKTDLLSFGINSFKLFNTGLKGLSHLEITAPADKIGDYNPPYSDGLYVYKQNNVNMEGKPYYIYSTSGYKSATAVLDNGVSFTEGDSLLDGKIKVERIDVSYVAGCDSYGAIPFRTQAESYEEQFDILKEFLTENDLSFRRDYDDVISGLMYAIKDAENFHKYYTWNGYHINDLEEAKKAIETEQLEIIDFKGIYDKIKDSEVIDMKDQEKYNANIHFADVEVVSHGTINNDGFKVSIKDLTAKVEDTLLFVDNEEYKVMFALMDSNANLISFTNDNELSTTYVKENPFETIQTTEIELDVNEEGNYVLVAYVALKSEGIRITNYAAVTGNITEYTVTNDGFKKTISVNETGNIIINCTVDYNLYYELTEDLTYEQLLEFMAQNAYNHGMIDELVIEKLDGENWIVVENPVVETQEETTVLLLEKGKYRMKYMSQNADEDVYVFVIIS